jgi:hypothetical protein
MSKRGGEPTRLRLTKVKKRKGVGSRVITVLSSDEEATIPAATDDYARITKTRVGSSGKADGVVTSSIPVFETEEVNVQAPEEIVNSFVDAAIENTIPAVPAKRRKKANDTVSPQPYYPFSVAENRSDQDAFMAERAVRCSRRDGQP